MIAALKRLYADFRGFDRLGSAVPMMDGPLKPNALLDAAPRLLELPGVDNLLVADGVLACSSGSALLSLSPAGDGTLAETARRDLGAEVSCLAADGAGALAVGLDGAGILVSGGRHDGLRLDRLGGQVFRCPTAACFLDADTLLVADGSAEAPASDWKRDLMSKRAAGSVWRVDLARGEALPLATGLAFPSGLCLLADGTLAVSEAWRHRVILLDPGRAAAPRTALADLPAYPGRLLRAGGGGVWLACFAPRNQLIEFVLLEQAYRTRMLETIEPDHWIAPALSSGASFLEPIQGGARKKLNQLKPWSPSWSYGLVVLCDAALKPLTSFHSRADGQVHGVTSLCEWNGGLLVGARGSGVVVALQSATARRPA